MNIRMAIADKNLDYLEKVSSVLQEHQELILDFFTEADALKEAMETTRYNIVLFDPDISEDRIYFDEHVLPVCLYSQNAQNLKYYTNIKNINKFQRISNIYKELISEYANHAQTLGIELSRSTNTQIIAVTSPVGGSGKTTVGCILANAVKNCGRSVLYVSTEIYNSSSVVYPNKDDGITALIQALDEKVNFELKVKGALNEHESGVMYIEGFDRVVDYNAVSKDEMAAVLNKIRATGIAEVIIVETGSMMDNIAQAVFETADKIIVVEVPGEIAALKIAAFADQIPFEISGKLAVLHNKVETKSRFGSYNMPVCGEIYNYGMLNMQDLIRYSEQKSKFDMQYILK